MAGPIDDAVVHLRRYYPVLDYHADGAWVRIPEYQLPGGWIGTTTAVAFQIPLAVVAPPYGFYVPAGIQCGGKTPQNNYREPSEKQPPFGGSWGMFSWQPVENQWVVAGNALGANLLSWVRSFAQRFGEGV